MPAILTRLLRDLLHQPPPGWRCLELDAALAADPARLASVRELVVRRPGDLTVPVLAAAPRLAAVLLAGRCWLPSEITAELARREIAVVRQLGTAAQPWRNASS